MRLSPRNLLIPVPALVLVALGWTGSLAESDPSAGAAARRDPEPTIVQVAWDAPGPRDTRLHQPGFADALIAAINQYRSERGLPGFAPSAALDALAAEHSRQMQAEGRLSHAGFMERLQRSGSRRCIENVAHGFPSAQTVLAGWRASPGHDRNLLDDRVAQIGIAVQDSYVTLFACR